MHNIKYNIENSLGSIIRRADRVLINRLNKHFRENGYDITTEQYRIFINLWNKAGQSQQELAEVTLKNKTSITRLINGLEQKKLVKRVPDKIDRRNKLIYLTRRGKKLPEALAVLAKKTLKQAQLDISEDDIKVCEKVLSKIIQNLK